VAAPGSVCFADREHEIDFDGYWSEPDANEAAVRWKAQDRIWDNTNRKRAQECPPGPIPNSKFTATTCRLPGWNPRTFVQLLGHGNTLWYVGDSVTRQMLLATASLLHQYGLRVEQDGPGEQRKLELYDRRNGGHFCLRAGGDGPNMLPGNQQVLKHVHTPNPFGECTTHRTLNSWELFFYAYDVWGGR
jgi:hypothetical protein